jgi:hypothetical protein
VLTRALAGLGRATRVLAAATTVEVPSGASIASIPADVLEAFGVHTGGVVTRDTAMGIPAMRRGRQLIAGTLGTLPLQAQRDTGGQLVPVDSGTTATLLAQLDPDTTPQWTLTWTLDDLMFGGIAWWRVLSRDSYGWPQAARRLRPGQVTVQGERAYIDGRPAELGELIRFDGPDRGLLVEGREALRTCLLLEQAARRNATGLPPMDILRPVEGAPDLTTTEVQELLDDWRALRAENGTGYLNRSLEHTVVGFDARSAQLVEARQHQAVEVARMLNLDAQELNAPAATGMTYTNTEAKRRDLLDVSCAPYMTAVTQRLSMPDITPRGQRVRLDTTGFLRGTTADAIKAAVEATGGPVMTSEESRSGLLGLPSSPTSGQLRTPSPAPAPQEEPA